MTNAMDVAGVVCRGAVGQPALLLCAWWSRFYHPYGLRTNVDDHACRQRYAHPTGFDVQDDGWIALTSSASGDEPEVFTAEQAACLRNQLGDALTVALRGARTARELDPS